MVTTVSFDVVGEKELERVKTCFKGNSIYQSFLH